MSLRERAFQSVCPSNTRAKVRRFSGGKPLALTHTCRKIHTALIFLISQTTLQPQVPQCHARGLEGQGENEVMKCMLKREKSMTVKNTDQQQLFQNYKMNVDSIAQIC